MLPPSLTSRQVLPYPTSPHTLECSGVADAISDAAVAGVSSDITSGASASGTTAGVTVLLTSSPVLLSLVLPRGPAEGSVVRVACCSTPSDSRGHLRIVKSEQGQWGRFQDVVTANTEQ